MNAEYLRISVTDRCNLRCTYCLPRDSSSAFSPSDLLTPDELHEVVRILSDKGITAVRFTGGEPLLRKDICRIIERTAGLPGIEDISLTTNGVLLGKTASDLKNAGLNRANVSLDTLDTHRYGRITQSDRSLKEVLNGIDAAQEAGLKPVKLNVVCLDSVEKEIAGFVRFGSEQNIVVRFIEFMPPRQCSSKGLLNTQVKQVITAKFGPLESAPSIAGRGPAEYAKVPGHGTVGFISPVSSPFCASCTRLRLSCDGNLLLCLQHREGLNIRNYLRPEVRQNELENALQNMLAIKTGKCVPPETVTAPRMRSIGG